ncbi:hypothetical protein AB0883_21040 [Micromonospora sp. NPDC047812]
MTNDITHFQLLLNQIGDLRDPATRCTADAIASPTSLNAAPPRP